MKDELGGKLEDIELNLDLNFDINDDYKRSKDILSRLASLIAVIAAFSAVFNNVSNAIFAHNVEKFYKIPAELFYYNRNFNLIFSIVIYILTSLVFFSPFYLREKWIEKSIDKSMAFFYSTLIGLYVLFFISVFSINFLVSIFKNMSNKSIFFIMILIYFLLCWFFYYLITGIFKFWEDISKLDLFSNTKSDENISNLRNIKTMIYIIYLIIIILTILFLNYKLAGPDINPKDKMSYEIIQNEKDFNVIIGYKDSMAITLTGEDSQTGGKMRLYFTSDEYMLKDVKDKSIVYRTFDKVIPYKGTGSVTGSNGSESKIVD